MTIMELESQRIHLTCDAGVAASPESLQADACLFRQLFSIFPTPVAVHRVVSDSEQSYSYLTIHDANTAFRLLFNIPLKSIVDLHIGLAVGDAAYLFLDAIDQAVCTGLPAQRDIYITPWKREYILTVLPLENRQQVSILTEMTRWKHIEHVQQQHIELANRSLRRAVSVLATLSAWRDQYTASHQMRVATLARAIGGEMGMLQDELDGLYIAGLLHDVGKLAVPLEILCKPGKINDHELCIIRQHPRVGYAVLRGMHFPWPIAQTVYQHHERLDGSGYPNALTADEIPLLARILAVADVVEAIASCRPYRASLGWDAALQEIIAHTGDLYDATVVAACHSVCASPDFALR